MPDHDTESRQEPEKPTEWPTPVGVMPGPEIGARSTTSPQPGPMVNRGQRAKPGSGGTRLPGAGWVSMNPISTGRCRNHLTTPRFGMMPDGRGQLFVHSGLKDGPLPVHYEPFESTGKNRLHPDQSTNPAAKRFERDGNRYHPSPDPIYPHVLTTYRLTEHQTAGAMSRNVPWLAELQPEAFAEIDTTIAARLGIQNGDWVVVSTLRGAVEVKALVTERMQPLIIDGRQIHQIGMPWHFGFSGSATGGSANDLSALAEDPNSLIHEGKSLTCAIRARSTRSASGEPE